MNPEDIVKKYKFQKIDTTDGILYIIHEKCLSDIMMEFASEKIIENQEKHQGINQVVNMVTQTPDKSVRKTCKNCVWYDNGMCNAVCACMTEDYEYWSKE